MSVFLVRVSDKDEGQVNNKPLAAQALGDLFQAMDPNEACGLLKAVSKPLVLGVADGKVVLLLVVFLSLCLAVSFASIPATIDFP